MKLRTKLLLGVGFLLFAMVLVLYLLPALLVRRDVYLAADQIHTLLIDEHNQLIKSQKLWLKKELGQTEQTINSLLYVIHDQPSFASTLTFTAGNSPWEGLARVAGYDPAIGFVQAHAPETKQTAVVSPHAAHFYPTAKGKGEMLTVYQEGGSFVYEGKLLSKEGGYTLYILQDPKEADFNQLEPAPITGNSPPYFWKIKMDMIQALLTNKGKGIARIDESGNGLSILSKDVFKSTPLFDDQFYYESHPPQPGLPPVAQRAAFVVGQEGNHAFVASTLLENNTFITIGIPLRELIRQLALTSNITVLLEVKNSFWIGFDEKGNKLSLDQVEAFKKAGVGNQKRGRFILNRVPYYFGFLSSINDGELNFYEVHPLPGEQSIIATLFELENRLSGKISFQLSLIALVVMILVLLFIGRIGYTVISPITKLARATEEVKAGKYHEVVLPEVGNRKDEVATLTRSFGDMVHGLEEREKIRAVLDKVVSKDVATEILRTQIHLGGEDRQVSMLFGDIRGFTELTEKATPQNTIEMLNDCMTKVSRVIEGEGGIIDKYVGDEVMAIFGAPTSVPDHALRAVSTAMLIIETLKKWNEERVQRGEPLVEMGIGVHSGLVVAGNMGAEDRLNYTVLGANVNLASRLCDRAKPGQLLISDATLGEANVKESFFVTPLEPIILKGFKEPVMIYQVTGFKWT